MSSRHTSHILVTLGVLFFLGGTVRVFTSTASANTELDGVENEQLAISNGSMLDQSASVAACSVEMTNLLSSDFTARAEREEAIRNERLALQAREQRLAAREQELENLRDELSSQWERLQLSADEDILHLSEMYAAMKSDEAATIFDQMDPRFAAGFLREMPGDAAGPILAEMNPDKAYRISIEIASRGAEVRNAASQ